MASSRSSSLCLSERSWAPRTSRPTMSLLGDPFAQSQCSSDVQAPVHTQNSENLDDMMTALMEQSGVQVRNEPPSHIERLHHEYNQLKAKQQRSHVPAPLAEDQLNRTMPSLSSGRDREDVSLQDLVEREMKASRELEQRRSQSIERGSHGYRSQSMDSRGRAPILQSLAPLSSDFQAFRQSVSQGLAPREMTQSVSSLPQSPAPCATTQSGALLSQTMAARRSSQWDRVDALMAQVNHLQKEMEKMDEALQQATEEASKMAEEKASCVKAHERDVASLENMLTSIMSENKTLKEALSIVAPNLNLNLSIAREKNPHKLTPSGVPDGVERVMISTLIHSGISNMSSSPLSSGSVSTETPPSPQEDLEECDRKSGKSGDSNASGTRRLVPPDE